MSRDSFEGWLEATMATVQRSGIDLEDVLDDPSPRPDEAAATNHAIGCVPGAAAALGLTPRELFEEYLHPR